MQKLKKGVSVVVFNNGKNQVGVIQSTYYSNGIRCFDVLLENGTLLKQITTNTEAVQYVRTSAKPITGEKLVANIDPDAYDFEYRDDYKPLFDQEKFDYEA